MSGLVSQVMRLGAAALVASLWLASPAHSSSCGRALPQAPAGLPAAVVVGVPCGTYALAPDGTVGQAPAPPQQRGDWLDWRGGHVVLLHDGHVVWRSRRAFGSTFVERGAVGPRDLAFDFARGRLWVASRRGVEHAVARNEDPLGWTASGGLLTARWSRRGATLRVRSETGSHPHVFARGVKSLAFEDATSTLLYVDPARGALLRTDGRHASKLAALDDLGLSWTTEIELLPNGLLDFQARDRIVILRGDGSVFASSLLPDAPRLDRWIEWAGWPAVGDNGIAFAVDDTGRERESIFVLRVGDRAATRVFDAAQIFEPCGSYSELAWHGEWLLYSTLKDTGQGSGEPALAAIDTTLVRPPIDLTGVVHALPGMGPDENGFWPGFSAVWG